MRRSVLAFDHVGSQNDFNIIEVRCRGRLDPGLQGSLVGNKLRGCFGAAFADARNDEHMLFNLRIKSGRQ